MNSIDSLPVTNIFARGSRRIVHRFVLLVLAASIGFSVNVADGQLLVGNSALPSSGLDQAWDFDPLTTAATPQWAGSLADVWGMAYDPASETIYVSSAVQLYAGTVGGGEPTLLGDTLDVNGNPLAMVGLAWAQGRLFATQNSPNEAIYEIDLTTLEAVVFFDYDDDLYDFGGLAYNSADGLFYATSDTSNELISIDAFGGGAITMVAAYPPGRTDIDGLAIDSSTGRGIAYLVEDQAGNTIHPYDVASGTYLPSLLSPMVSSELFSGAAFVSGVTGGGFIPPTSFNVFRGFQLSGDVTDFESSDDVAASYNPGFTLTNLEAPVWIEFFANAPTAINFRVESSAGTPGIEHTVEAFNFANGSYDIIGVQTESFNVDQVVEFPVVPADHIDANGDVQSRVGWRQVGFTLNFPWTINVDQTGWTQ